MSKTSQKKGSAPSSKEGQLRAAHKRRIINTFTGAGFTSIPINDHEMQIGLRTVEIDGLFIYENIWLMIEDTVTSPSNMKPHIRTKNEAFGEIKTHLDQFIEYIVKLIPDKKDILKKYRPDRIKLFGLYIPREDPALTEIDYQLYSNLIFVLPKTLSYFQWIVQCIKHSARNEIFRFLNLQSKDIGLELAASSNTQITAPIIYPSSFTGIKNDIRVVSFMMSAEDLLETCYVLRKDNWADSIWLYQRLIDKNKIVKIRDFLTQKGEAFYNNIIVALPDTIAFRDESGHFRNIEEINSLEGNCQLILPKDINSICVIDGQHRIYAHYESGSNSAQEKKISELRKQLHLLVTGLVFPRNMSSEERVRIQSGIFLDINSNAKPVPPNVLLQIKRINNPIADESIAQYVIEKLNQQGIFQNMLQLSTLDSGKIKTASIVKFALRYLVTVNPSKGKHSLFEYWNGDKEALKRLDSNAIENYVGYCASSLRCYFGAVKTNFSKQWDDENSKILSTISLNGFIIAFTRQLGINGVNEFEYYNNVFRSWSMDFTKDGFIYTSSQYKKFSTQILQEAFKISEDQLKQI